MDIMRRNFYSTKLITVRSVASDYDDLYNPSKVRAETYSESPDEKIRNLGLKFVNPLQGEDLDRIFH